MTLLAQQTGQRWQVVRKTLVPKVYGADRPFPETFEASICVCGLGPFRQQPARRPRCNGEDDLVRDKRRVPVAQREMEAPVGRLCDRLHAALHVDFRTELFQAGQCRLREQSSERNPGNQEVRVLGFAEQGLTQHVLKDGRRCRVGGRIHHGQAQGFPE